MVTYNMLIWRHILLGMYAIQGYIYKSLVDLHIIKIPCLTPKKSAGLIVSLTSYGRRVSTNVVFYSIVSLLRQERQPCRIVLWLADEEWNNNTLPSKLLELEKKGLEIRYCKDIKSYKKLIPSLKENSGLPIVTVDDDVIYSKDTVKIFEKEHQRFPHDILCFVARYPVIKGGIPQGYAEWDDSLITPFKDGMSGRLLFPVGVGGVLYPADALAADVIDEAVFMNCCPSADDIWFWFCGLRNNTTKRYIVKSGKDVSFDALYQYLHRGAALTHSNCALHQNDAQIKRLFEYYHYKIDKLYE